MDIHNELFSSAEKSMNARLKKNDNSKEVIKLVGEGFTVLTNVCGGKDCEDEIRAKAEGLKVLMYPLDQPKSMSAKKCTFCNQQARHSAYVGRSY